MYQYLVKTFLIMTLFSVVLTAGQTGENNWEGFRPGNW